MTCPGGSFDLAGRLGRPCRMLRGYTSALLPVLVTGAPDQDLAAIQCSEYDPNADPFEPSRDVTFDRSAGEYVIDRIAFEELKLDPAPLFGDATTLREHELGHQVAAAGELSNALGWQVGDVLLDLDGHPLRNLAEFSVAYTVLAETSNFELTLRRGRNDIVLKYRVE